MHFLKFSLTVKCSLVVLTVALLAAAPFMTKGPLGTSEAYNYSLALADTVTQMRNGTLPVLAGQSEFAFNGRVHPLRTAPYLNYMAGLMDLLTFRQLGFWALQNSIIALSLIAGALACFWSLIKVTPTPPPTAAALASLYVFSPAVLAAAYGMDLYMTVTTVPFLPIALAMCVRAFSCRQPTDLVKLVTALAACWLAHPPVAFWLSVSVLFLQVIALFINRPRGREWLLILAMILLFIILAGFSFASALTIAPYEAVSKTHDLTQLFNEVNRAFPGSLRPISLNANQIGDFQLGYVVWALAGLAVIFGLTSKNTPALSLLGVAGLLFALTAPIPQVNHWLWTHAPSVALNLTNQWPMQRLYLPITLLILMAFALVWRTPELHSTASRDAIRAILLIAIIWTGWQGTRFISRGFSTQQVAIQRGHISGNINLTGISYALLGIPGSFVNGVMDPAFEFRLLAPYDGREVYSNWRVPLPAMSDNQSGFLEAQTSNNQEILDLSPPLSLQPDSRYRLTLNFLVPPAEATLQLIGPTLFRQYPLPISGYPRGFGMQPGNNPQLTLWTSQSKTEEVRLRVVGQGLNSGPWANRRFAGYKLERIQSTALPIQLESLLPLRAKVNANIAGYLETPRVYIPGYEAEVDGRSVRVQPSPEGMAMVPVPAGQSRIELRYPGPQITRIAFWISCAGWLSVGLGSIVLKSSPKLGDHLITYISRRTRIIYIVFFASILATTSVWAWVKWTDHRLAVGPVRIRFALPRGETNRQQPLLVTGKPYAGTFIYVAYHDAEHIRIGVDVWGLLGYQSEPIRTDYFADHEVVIEAGSLYPQNHPKLRGQTEETIKRLNSKLRVIFDGTTVINRDIDTYPSKVNEVTIGKNLLGGSSCEPNFAGKILSVERLSPNWDPRQ